MATASGLGVFWKLLLLWRGSIYKLVWTNLALYIVLYYSLSLTYRFLLDPGGRVSRQYNQDIDIDIAYLCNSRKSSSRSVSTARNMRI